MAQFLGRYARRLARAPADLFSSQPSDQTHCLSPYLSPRVSKLNWLNFVRKS
jgi:hypothetical protein